VRTTAHTKAMRNIPLSAAEELIDQARDKARAQGATLNDEFRKWLASYVQAANGQTSAQHAIQSTRDDAPELFFKKQGNQQT
jgi:hypothetical protein